MKDEILGYLALILFLILSHPEIFFACVENFPIFTNFPK
jgi:hypothetical protein